jgi:Leucine rich repeat
LIEQCILEGLPELQELDMYGNKVLEIIIPSNPKLLSKLEALDLGYNDIIHLPGELDQLKSLRTLKLMNNFLSIVPMRVCDMDLKILDVASNPVTTPPLDTCERGICSMKRYWAQIRRKSRARRRHQWKFKRDYSQSQSRVIPEVF